MANKWLKLIEVHIEKGIIGLAGLFMLYMLWAFIISSPNKIKYGGSEVGPRELCVAIQSDARSLEQAYQRANEPDPEPVSFANKLERNQIEGIYAEADDGAPPLDRSLEIASPFGGKIEVPGLEENEEPASISLVLPLRPSQPIARTGISMVVRDELRLGQTEDSEPITPEADSAKSEEQLSWVTIGAYYDKQAQYNEMVKAGYAPYRCKAYVVGIDVQRQEMQSNSEWSDWVDVPQTDVMPKLDVRQPAFDDITGELVNKQDIRETFAVVKQEQATIMQPPFFAIEDGDFWDPPELEGHEDLDDEEEEEDEPVVTRGERETRPLGPTAPPSTGLRPGGRSMGFNRGPSRGESGPSGTGVPRASGASSSKDNERAERQKIRDDLNGARQAMAEKDYREASDLAQKVIGNANANKGDRNKAKKIKRAAEKRLERMSPGAASGGGPREGRPGALRGGGGSSGASTARPVGEYITHPDDARPAIWFHDDTVEAGKTYRYRMRVRLWNRYVGRVRSMRDPQEAKQSVIEGKWSFPSDAITVSPSRHFFVRGGNPQTGSATVDVWTWRKGSWLKQSFEVEVGDRIGGLEDNVKTNEFDDDGKQVRASVDFSTGAVVLDLRFDEKIAYRSPKGKDGSFDYSDKTSLVIVYLDPADGQVKERVQLLDKYDEKRNELEDELIF